MPADQHLGAQLKRCGVRLDEVKRVIILHLHADHVAGLRDLPRARFTALRADVGAARRHVESRRPAESPSPGAAPDDFSTRLDVADDHTAVRLDDEWSPFTHGFDLIGDGSLIAIPLPGHTAAQMGLVVRRGDGSRCLLAADACWSGPAMRDARLPSPLIRPLVHDWSAYRHDVPSPARALARAARSAHRPVSLRGVDCRAAGRVESRMIELTRWSLAAAASFARTRWGWALAHASGFARVAGSPAARVPASPFDARAVLRGNCRTDDRRGRTLGRGDITLADLPIVDKQTLLTHFDALNTRDIRYDDAMAVALAAERSRDFRPELGDVTVGLSSGTSGQRVPFLVSARERMLWAASILARMLDTASLARIASPWQPPLDIAFFLRANSNLYTTLDSRRVTFAFYDLLHPIDAHVDALMSRTADAGDAARTHHRALADLDRSPDCVGPDVLVAPATVLRRLADVQLEGRCCGRCIRVR